MILQPRLHTTSLLAIFVVLAVSCGEDRATSRLAPRRQERAGAVARSAAVVRREGNHLVDAPSPYLLQHAHNPVDWYPWGPEALERARAEHKPVFLSIGYSTCHWCHVMEEESFENDEVATFLNEHFIAIKVDREQRPDVDALYLEAVRGLGGSTGWPLTVVLTPSLVPFFGGTYFPREGGMGRPGLLDILRDTSARWERDGDAVAGQGRRVLAEIEARARAVSGDGPPLSPSTLDAALVSLARARDSFYGGFGRQQKFPNAPLLLAELRYVERTDDAATRAHLVTTLERAMRGGIHDALSGTFHRYATDREWHVPHFEKTLYDNAQLAQVYVEAGRALGRDDFVSVGRAILDDLIASWQQEDGGFPVGFDADDPGGEGAYYTWTRGELEAALGVEDGRIFATLFGVTTRGEPLLEGRSVLHRIAPDDARERLSLDPASADAFVARARPRLRAVRARRRPPSTDDKELASWNGLAIAALANVGRWLDEPRYVEAAERAAAFVLDRCWEGGSMLRGRRRGESLGEGFLDDHALVALALLRLHAADGDARWLLAARAIGAAIVERFYDERSHVFLQSARADAPEGLPLRRPDTDDGVLPSGGNAAALLALELGAIAGDRELYAMGVGVARAGAPAAVNEPFGAGFLLVVLDHLVGGSREVVLAGDRSDPRFAVLQAEVRGTTFARALPVRLDASGPSEELAQAYPALTGKVALDAIPTAYVCEIGRCELPTHDPAALRRQLLAVRATTVR